MKKVLFLMILLLLMGLGAVGVKAQVRIGGNTPPNPAAALDLNAAEGTTTGTKGLALPRVTLSSNTATLDGTTANITGMLVYNAGGTLSAGIYFWSGSAWVLANLPRTTLADSGMVLISNGSGWVPGEQGASKSDTIVGHPPRTLGPVTFTLIVDTLIATVAEKNASFLFKFAGLDNNDLCAVGATGGAYVWRHVLDFIDISPLTVSTHTMHSVSAKIRCYRPSI